MRPQPGHRCPTERLLHRARPPRSDRQAPCPCREPRRLSARLKPPMHEPRHPEAEHSAPSRWAQSGSPSGRRAEPRCHRACISPRHQRPRATEHSTRPPHVHSHSLERPASCTDRRSTACPRPPPPASTTEAASGSRQVPVHRRTRPDSPRTMRSAAPQVTPSTPC